MDASSEIKFLKAKVALLETEKKHLIQKVADLEKRKFQAPHNILSPSINISVIPKENQREYPIEQKIQLLKNIFRGREDVHARYYKKELAREGQQQNLDWERFEKIETISQNSINILTNSISLI